MTCHCAVEQGFQGNDDASEAGSGCMGIMGGHNCKLRESLSATDGDKTGGGSDKVDQ